MNLLAQQRWFEGDLAGFTEASEDASAAARRRLRLTHPTALEADRFLAGTLADLGDLQQSYAVRLAILRRAEQEFGADHHETATYRNSLAIAERRLGNYTAARREFERVLSAVTARYGESHDFVATTRLNLAIVDANLGDIAAARRDHTVALRIWERSLGPTASVRRGRADRTRRRLPGAGSPRSGVAAHRARARHS